MISSSQDGGLGILSITNAVMERKRKCLLEQGNAGGMIGVAMRSQICRIIRDAGRGGLGTTKTVLWTSVREWGTGLSALVEWLKEVNIRIRVGTGSAKEWEPVEKYESEINKRISLNARGIVLRSELEEGGRAPLRTGQCWLLNERVVEILGFNATGVEIMYWDNIKGIEVGRWVEVMDDKCDTVRQGYPTGAGGRNTITKEDLMRSKALVELEVDKFTKKGTVKSRVAAIRKIESMETVKTIPYYMKDDSARWNGAKVTHIYTDGSYKEEANWG